MDDTRDDVTVLKMMRLLVSTSTQPPPPPQYKSFANTDPLQAPTAVETTDNMQNVDGGKMSLSQNS